MDEKSVLNELQEIAHLTGAKDIKQGRVICEFLKRHPGCKGMSKSVYEKTIVKIFFQPDDCVYAVKTIPNENDMMIKRTQTSSWERSSCW